MAIGWALLAVLALSAMYVADTRRQRRSRAALFADCLVVLRSYRVTQQGADYPVLEGSYRGVRAKVEPVIDTIAWRKIPSLWLKVTVFAPNPHAATLDLLVRPEGVEFYSPNLELPYRVPIPDGWPQHAALRTDDPERMPPLDRLAPYVGRFEDPKLKELLTTPRGVRLVYQLWQAERAEYLVLRQARFDQTRMDAALLQSLLDSALAVSSALCDSASPAQAA